MKRYILNITGSFGSGKSSLARALMPAEQRVELKFKDFASVMPADVRPGKTFATLFPISNVAFVGPYQSACGGCDALVKVEIMAALNYLVFHTGYNVIFEGVAVSGCRTYTDYISHLPVQTEITPLVVALYASVATHHSRVLQRNGGKPVNIDHIKAKHKAVEYRIMELPDLGVEFVVIDEPSIEEAKERAVNFLNSQTA